MSEHYSPPPGPPKPEGAGQHKFTLSPEEAQDMGLTNSEAMRYRWTGELPDHAQHALNTIFRAQTSRLDPLQPRKELVREPLPPVPEFQDQDEFLVWAQSEFDRMKLVADDPSAPVTPEEAQLLLEHTGRWFAAANAHYFQYDYDLAPVYEAAAHLVELTERPGTAAGVVADIIDAEGKFSRLFYSSVDLGGEIRRQPLNVLALLQVRDTEAGSVAGYEVADRMKQASSRDMIAEIAVTNVQPLADHLKTRLDDTELAGIGSALAIMHDFTGAIKRDPEALTEAERRGFDLRHAADSFLSALAQEIPYVSEDNPMHYQAANMLETLEGLYPAPDAMHAPPPPVLVDFIRAIYQGKVKPFAPSYSAIPRINESLRSISKKYGYDLSDITR